MLLLVVVLLVVELLWLTLLLLLEIVGQPFQIWATGRPAQRFP